MALARVRYVRSTISSVRLFTCIQTAEESHNEKIVLPVATIRLRPRRRMEAQVIVACKDERDESVSDGDINDDPIQIRRLSRLIGTFSYLEIVEILEPKRVVDVQQGHCVGEGLFHNKHNSDRFSKIL